MNPEDDARCLAHQRSNLVGRASADLCHLTMCLVLSTAPTLAGEHHVSAPSCVLRRLGCMGLAQQPRQQAPCHPPSCDEPRSSSLVGVVTMSAFAPLHGRTACKLGVVLHVRTPCGVQDRASLMLRLCTILSCRWRRLLPRTEQAPVSFLACPVRHAFDSMFSLSSPNFVDESANNNK